MNKFLEKKIDETRRVFAFPTMKVGDFARASDNTVYQRQADGSLLRTSPKQLSKKERAKIKRRNKRDERTE